MAWSIDPVPDLFRTRWRSGQHIGAAKPHQVVEICRGGSKRGYYHWTGDDVNARIYGERPSKPWMPKWNYYTDWVELPNVLEVGLNQDFDQNGLTVATVDLENVGFIEKTGLGGVYHAIEHGFLSPFRGYNPATRPAKGPHRNEWFNLLARMSRLRIWQGYGEPERDGDGQIVANGGSNGAWVFAGLIDEVDPEAHPDRVTVTARDFGKMLTDQRILMWNKSRTINDPVVFMDRLEADKVTAVGGAAAASSQRDGHHARFVCDDSTKTAWMSRDHPSANVTEWVQIRVPAGRYEEIVIDPAYAEMECFVGFYAKSRVATHGTVTGTGNVAVGTNVKPPTMDGEVIGEGWIFAGLGDVPGGNGGWPYMRHIARLGEKQRVVKLNHTIVCGDNSIVRIGLRRLKRITSGHYRAGITRLQARHRQRTVNLKETRIILVDDVSDMVKVCLRWAGFTEWEIETTGVRLKGRAVFNRSSFLIDPITKATEQTGFVFYVGDPSDSDSRGVPVFRKNRALLEPPAELLEVRDSDLLTGIKVQISEEPLAWNIRVRGKETSNKKYVQAVGGDTTRRIMAYYKPPWTRAGRMAGVLKHVTHTYPELKTFDECLFAAYLIALGEALQAVTGVLQIPGNPGLNLDDQIGVLDTATGMNTRLWIANRSSTFHVGEQPSWVMTLGGSFIDTPDMTVLVAEYQEGNDDARWVGRPATNTAQLNAQAGAGL
jgi:hypothetical protein